jgi:hypothetical protein
MDHSVRNEYSFRHMRRRWTWAWALGLLAGGCFVEDELPGGEEGVGAGQEPGADVPVDPEELGALGGEYEAELRTVRCEGDCVGASTILGPTTFCDVGDLDTDTVDVWQDDVALTVDVSQGRLQGSIDDEGAFEAEGTSTESGGQLEIDMSATGRFTGRHDGFAGTVRFSVVGTQDGDRVDCHGELEVIATWRSDGCRDDADACPDGWPICVNDGCYAGAEGDPCGSDDECTGGRRCNVQVCTTPAPVDGACEYDEDCASGLQCVREACSAGQPGDPCVFAHHCPAGACVDEVCTDGATGAACNGSSDCTSGICVTDVCRDGTTGDPCTWDSDCAAGFSCLEDTCAAS